MVPIPETRAGMELAGFRLVRKLGEGGMGEVWLAEQLAMSRQVALKILSPKLVRDADFIRRFDHEIHIAGKLRHPNIITAYDAGHVQGLYYLAMFYVDGVELADRLKTDKIIPEKMALHLARDVADALDYAWSEFKILHRDIKPSNIMIDKNGRGMLMDMGISKSLIEDFSMTISGTVVGTPYYISPEQARGDKSVDFHSDIYSLGATLYHVLTGKTPFDGATTLVIMTKHVTDRLKPPRELNPRLSPAVNHLICNMMAKDWRERPKSWQQVVRDIDLVLAGQYPESDAVGVPESTGADADAEETMAVRPPPPREKFHTPINITINRTPPPSASAPTPTPESPAAPLKPQMSAADFASGPQSETTTTTVKRRIRLTPRAVLLWLGWLMVLAAIIGVLWLTPRIRTAMQVPGPIGNQMAAEHDRSGE
ncbi:MAG: serine/threonine-protein kinase [Victivallales bacterium]|nr:serine/threonine-protein kinase [Victivallales bacterium]